MKILIVDDNDVALVMLHNALRQAGYEVVTAISGQDALAILRQGEVRLVISDWQMPGMSGIELCRLIRTEDLPGYIYFILLTSYDAPDERVEGLSAGADDFITKPFHNAELLARIRAGQRVLALETREVAIFAMAKLAESRDPETGHHLERVRTYSRLLAQRMANMPQCREQIDSEYIRLLYLTSPLHDIGKVGIPDCVLLKAGRLSDREFEVMKTHTIIGRQTLNAALQMFPGVKFLEMARDIAGSHHERVDGHGYPDGLAGDEIPLCARIVSLADVYDALSSKRVYKPAYSHEVAKSIIVEARNTQFDSNVVDAFLQAEAQFVATCEQLAESRAAAA